MVSRLDVGSRSTVFQVLWDSDPWVGVSEGFVDVDLGSW